MPLATSSQHYFSNDSFAFLSELARHNQRDWFNDNKQRYEDAVRGPALAFIADIAPRAAAHRPAFSGGAEKGGWLADARLS